MSSTKTPFGVARTVIVRAATLSNMVGVIVLFALVVIMNTDVIARGVFHAPIHGVVELVIFALVLIVFLQLPDVVENNRLTRSDGFITLLSRSNPSLAALVSRVIDGVSAAFFLLACRAVWPEFVESFESCHFFSPPEFGAPPTGDLIVDLRDAWNRCDYFGTPGIFTAPWWPAKLVIVYGLALSGILFLTKALLGDYKKGATGNET